MIPMIATAWPEITGAVSLPMKTIIVRCVVAALNAEGVPDFFAIKVRLPESEYDNGSHYNAAQNAAEEGSYECERAVVFDENDKIDLIEGKDEEGKPLFDWNKIPTIDA